MRKLLTKVKLMSRCAHFCIVFTISFQIVNVSGFDGYIYRVPDKMKKEFFFLN